MRSDDALRDALARAHREASAQVGDAPDPSVRAAVLAAAARGVDARPRLAATVSTAPGPRPSGARRWPLSVAALLVVSVMTGLVATQVMRDSPERITTVAPPAPAPAASAPAPTLEPRSDVAALARPEQAATAPRDASPPPSVNRKPSPKREAVHQQARADETLPSADRTTRPEALAQSGAAVPPPPVALAAPAPEPAARMRAEAPAADREAQANQDRHIASSMDEAPTVMRARIGRIAEPATPEAWVERIVTLRAIGRDAEADRELDGLRRRYPGFAVPADALRATGTR